MELDSGDNQSRAQAACSVTAKGSDWYRRDRGSG